MSGPEYLGTTVLVLAWFLAAVAIGIVGTRLYVRWRIVGKYTVDDGLILIALVSLTGIHLKTRNRRKN